MASEYCVNHDDVLDLKQQDWNAMQDAMNNLEQVVGTRQAL